MTDFPRLSGPAAPHRLGGTPGRIARRRGAEDDDGAAEIAEAIRRMTAGVARAHDLHDLFGRVDALQLCHSAFGFLRDRFVPHDFWRAIADGDLIAGLQNVEGGWALPYPHLLVGWTDVARNLPFRVMRRCARAAAGEDGHEDLTRAVDEDWYEDLTRADGTPFRARGAIVAEIRLAILPVGPGGRPEAAFLTRLWTVVELGRCRHRDDAGPVYEPFIPGIYWDDFYGGMPQAEEDLQGLRTEPAFLPDDCYEAFRRFGWRAEAVPECDHVYLANCGYDEVTRVDFVSPASCRRLEGLRPVRSPLDGETRDVVAFVPYFGPLNLRAAARRRARKPSPLLHGLEEHARTPPRSLARVLERSIFRVPRRHRLDGVLKATCDDFAAELARYLACSGADRARVKRRS